MATSKRTPVKRRPCLSLLSEVEINDILREVYDALPKVEKTALHNATAELEEINGMGFLSALRFLLVACPQNARKLDQLDAHLLRHSVPQDGAPVTFSGGK